MISKKMIDIHNKTPRGNATNMSIPTVESYDAPAATYNLPQDLLQESEIPQAPSKNQPMTVDRVMASKLPDAIKQLMIEHPISQPNSSGPTLSNDLVDKAARLMNLDNNHTEPVKQRAVIKEQSQPLFNNTQLKELLREVVEEVLNENGLLIESTQKSNELFSFKVGKHIFEGKVTKIKKIS